MNKIALIPIKGMIVSEKSAVSGVKRVASTEIVSFLREVQKDKSVKAVVLEINSPGGTPFPCKEIADTIKAMHKPVISWVREVAASGGYWVAAAADAIVSSNLSTLGSIGVVSVRPDLSGLLKHLGIDVDALASGPHKLYGVPAIPLTPEQKQEERQRREDDINLIQQSFLDEIKGSRQLNDNAMVEISSGKTYLGLEAKDLGLVDEIGGREQALKMAASRAGIAKYKVVDYTRKLERPRKGLLGKLLDGFF